MDTILFAARIMLGGFLIFRGVAQITKTGASSHFGSLVAYDFPAIVAGLMGVTLLLSGFCIVCGIWSW